MEEENFQVWLAKNWDQPLSNEVERLQHELERLQVMHRADARRLEEARSARRGLIRYVFLLSLGMLALLLWFMNRYSETRDALQEVCAFIAREVNAKIKEDAAETPSGSLKQVHGICDEKVALGAKTR
jgi:ferric-dicitrate binding protein FerR (iron transport regulator)